jgi:hypothetical protein
VGSPEGTIPTRREVNEKMLGILKRALKDVEERLALLRSGTETAREVAESCFDIDALRKNPVGLLLTPDIDHSDPVVQILVRSSSRAHVRWNPWSRPHIRLPARLRWEVVQVARRDYDRGETTPCAAEAAELSRSSRFQRKPC